MTAPSTAPRSAPDDAMEKEDFYAADEKRRHSHVLSYGSGWRVDGWTDNDHKVEIFWLGKTHEIVAYYITYDWNRLSPGKATRDAVAGAALDIFADNGVGIGRELADQDLATSDIKVQLLGHVSSDLEAHRLLWDWRWAQHHPNGFATVAQRIREHAQ